MYRNKTVQALLRDQARERQLLLAKIDDLLDRLMYMADRPWTPTPADMEAPGPRANPYEDFVLPDATVID